MNTLATGLLSFILLYKYVALFLVMFIAAVAVPLPTSTVLLATGAFASQGYFNIFLSFAVALIGNVGGDSVDYYLARRYGRPILHKLRIHIPPYITRLEEYVKKHPGWTVFFTRFAGAADIVANFLAGFSNVPFAIFLFYDALGNAIAIAGVMYAGYYLGVHWQDFLGIFSVIGWIAIACIIVATLAVTLWYRSRRRA